MRPIPAITAAAAMTVMAMLLAGCSVSDELTGVAAEPKPVTVVMVDISGSTLGQRDAYVADAMTALKGTAELDGATYLSTVDGLATNDTWPIADRRFSTRIGGANEILASAARSQQAERLRPQVTRLLDGRGDSGSDLLAMLTNLRRLLCTLPDVERRVVIISDGGVVAGGVNLYRHPPLTERVRARLIERLRRSGEIPTDLGCQAGSPVRVWLSGLGVGIHRREVAIAVRRFFIQAVESTGAVVVAEGPKLLRSSFLDPVTDSREWR